MPLDGVTERIRSQLDAFAGLDARVLFDLGEDGVIAVDATKSPPELSREAVEADCTIKLSAENLAKLIDGELNPMMAYTLGKLKVEGSMAIAMKVAALLED